MASVSRKGAAPMSPGVPSSCVDTLLPVVDGVTAIRRDGRMRRQAQKAAPQLALETVHDGDDRDQGEHAQRNTEQRHPGDERDEKAMLASQGVAQAHEHRNGLKHFAAH